MLTLFFDTTLASAGHTLLLPLQDELIPELHTVAVGPSAPALPLPLPSARGGALIPGSNRPGGLRPSPVAGPSAHAPGHSEQRTRALPGCSLRLSERGSAGATLCEARGEGPPCPPGFGGDGNAECPLAGGRTTPTPACHHRSLFPLACVQTSLFAGHQPLELGPTLTQCGSSWLVTSEKTLVPHKVPFASSGGHGFEGQRPTLTHWPQEMAPLLCRDAGVGEGVPRGNSAEQSVVGRAGGSSSCHCDCRALRGSEDEWIQADCAAVLSSHQPHRPLLRDPCWPWTGVCGGQPVLSPARGRASVPPLLGADIEWPRHIGSLSQDAARGGQVRG